MFKIGDKIIFTEKITDEMVRKFAEVSGDKNPMHLDDEYASKTRFGKRIAHGMIFAALFSRGLAQELGPGGIYLSQTLKFINPVFIDDIVTIEITVTNLKPERGLGVAETLCKNQHGELCVKGEAMIMSAEHVK